MGQCISNKSNKSEKEFVIRYNPTSSTTLYKNKQSGIFNIAGELKITWLEFLNKLVLSLLF